MQLTELTQPAVEILKVKVWVIGIVICCDDIAATIIRQQLAKSQLLHASLQHRVVLLVSKKNSASQQGFISLPLFHSTATNISVYFPEDFHENCNCPWFMYNIVKVFFTFPSALWDNTCCTYLCPFQQFCKKSFDIYKNQYIYQCQSISTISYFNPYLANVENMVSS
jgi:hypothetical protein